MLIKKIGEIEVYELDEAVKKLTKSEKELIIKKLFQNQYQGKILNYTKLNQDMFVRVNSRTRENFSERKHYERKKEHRAKLNLGAEGDFIDLVNNPDYIETKKEKKVGQSARHKKGNKYHYFQKMITVENSFYIVTISVRETQHHNCFVHNVSLKEQKDLPLLPIGKIKR